MDFEKVEQEKIEKVNKILQLCFEINTFEKRDRENTGEKPTVFMEFMGHIAVLEVKVFRTGWYPYATEEIKFRFDLSRPLEELKAYFQVGIDYLEELKEVSQNEHLQQVI